MAIQTREKTHFVMAKPGTREDITKPLADGKAIVILGPGGGGGVDLTRPTIGYSGRPHSGKQVVSLRLDPDVIAKFRATGAGWQARINEILRKA